MLYRSSAPGSLMVIGEHAVLHDQPCVVSSINKRINVTLVSNQSQQIQIKDTKHELLSCSKNEIDNHIFNEHYYKFVLAVIKILEKEYGLPNGFSLSLESEMSDTVGFGTSAAAVVATSKVILQFLNIKISNKDLFLLAKKATMLCQKGMGSGADLAASIYGGLVMFENNHAKKLNFMLPEVVVIYSGYKTKTVEVIKKVNDYAESSGLNLSDLYKRMGALVRLFIEQLECGDVYSGMACITDYQDCMRKLLVSDKCIEAIIFKLAKLGLNYSKISGSGLGDCVIGFDIENRFNTSSFILDVGQEIMNIELGDIGVVDE